MMRFHERCGLILAAALTTPSISGGQPPGPQAGTPAVPVQFRAPRDFSNANSGDRRIQLRTFHAIFFFDSLDPRHGSAPNNQARLRFLLDNFNAEAVKSSGGNFNFQPFPFQVAPTVAVLDGPLATADQLDRVIGELEKDEINGVKQGDVVFFWAEAEGRSDGQGRRYLVPCKGEEIARDYLLRRLEFPARDPVTGAWKRRTKLTVFITDSCSTVSGGPATPEEFSEPPKIWRSLYFGHSGTVDISSSSPGQMAFSVDGDSLFARAFSRTFDGAVRKELFKADDDPIIEWDGKFFERLKTEVDRLFRAKLASYYVFRGGLPTEETTDAFDRLPAEEKGTMRALRDQFVRGQHFPQFIHPENVKVNGVP